MSTDTAAIAVKPAATSSSAVVLVGRVLLSSLFILAGYAKLTGLAGTAGWFGSIGLPMPMVTAVVVGLLELFGGLAILVGFQTRLAAVALAIFTLAATAIAHMDLGDQMQMLLFQKNISIVGGLLILAAFGAGALSIDNRR
jgi:putative oxidoreductase